MYLKSIELSGFKSFAKKSELKFSSSISAIVGPNGSGKSNIAEAFRFVLGEQSIKSLRGKRGEDLIFNGAGDMPKSNRASVKVLFDNSKKFLPVDFEEVSVERVVHRDGVNEYLINGSTVRLRDVIEMLASAHIGASGHHIISQGEADRILNSSIKERKVIIEDALGLKIYQYKKQESQKKLLKTKENIDKTESLRREISPHIKFLKKQVEKVQKSLELKEELHIKASEYLAREAEYLKRSKQKIADSKKPLEEKMLKLEAELSLVRDVLQKSGEADQKSVEIVGLENDLRNIRNKRDELIRRSGQIGGEISSLERMLLKQKVSIDSHSNKTVPLLSVEKLLEEIKNKRIKIGETRDADILLRTISEIENLLHSFVEENKDKVDMALIIEIENDISRLLDNKKNVEESLVEIKNTENKIIEDYELCRTQIEHEKDKNREAEKNIFRLSSERENLRLAMREIGAEEEILELTERDYNEQLVELGVILGEYMLRKEQVVFDYDLEFNDSQSVSQNPGRVKQEERLKNIEKLKIRLEEMSSLGQSGADVMKEYQDVTERDKFLEKELSDLVRSAETLSQMIVDLDNRLASEFKVGLERINFQFREYFSLMFGGGDAQIAIVKEQKKKNNLALDLEDKDLNDEFSDNQSEEDENENAGSNDGLEIEVSLPKKKVKSLMMLSGGERALTSIALLFAISQVNPPPFVILDETDAALDEANSKKYGDMIENLSKHSQLIVITHNRETMSRAGILYGVTMISGSSKLLSVAFDEAVAVAK